MWDDTVKNQSEIRVAVQRERLKLKQAQARVQMAIHRLRAVQAECDHPGIDYTVLVPRGRVCPDCGAVVR